MRIVDAVELLITQLRDKSPDARWKAAKSLFLVPKPELGDEGKGTG